MNKPALLRRGVSGSTLKLIALGSMLIDHMGACIIGRGLFSTVDAAGALLTLYWVMRGIGRIAFPIYCFLLAEGMAHTRSRGKYLLRLGLFALVSEVPFDLCFYGEALYWGHQNVFWTLALGGAAICALDALRQRRQLRWFYLLALCILAGALLQTDYGAFGVFYICLLYFLRAGKPWLRNLWGCVAIAWELSAPLAFLPIQLYNGQRGMGLKYVFYLFYPLHLFLLGFIAYGLFGV